MKEWGEYIMFICEKMIAKKGFDAVDNWYLSVWTDILNYLFSSSYIKTPYRQKAKCRSYHE